MTQRLADAIEAVALTMPLEVVARLVDALRTGGAATQWAPTLEARVGQEESRRLVRELVARWMESAPVVTPESVGLALDAASRSVAAVRKTQRIELIWSGPDSRVVPLRRTDQALLEVIEGATRSLHVVSFAVYKVPTIVDALIARAREGVRVALYLETANASEGKIAYDTVRALGPGVGDHVTIYIWPRDRRPTSASGKHGSLHAKLALADGQTLFLSSANLTEYALTLNMEMGLLVRGGALPPQVAQHLASLVERGDFVAI